MNKSLVIRSILVGVTSSMILCGMLFPSLVNAISENPNGNVSPTTLVYNGHLTLCKLDKTSYQVVKTMKMMVTAYSSTPDQTDDTPFTTASGKMVADTIIANNKFPFGTRVRIPSLFGDKVFTVEDRMHPRMGTNHVDIWFPEYIQAKNFGAKYNVTIEVLES